MNKTQNQKKLVAEDLLVDFSLTFSMKQLMKDAFMAGITSR